MEFDPSPAPMERDEGGAGEGDVSAEVGGQAPAVCLTGTEGRCTGTAEGSAPRPQSGYVKLAPLTFLPSDLSPVPNEAPSRLLLIDRLWL